MTQLANAMRRAARIGGRSFVAVTGASSVGTLYDLTPMCWDYYQFYRSKSTSSADEEEELLRRLHEKHAPLALQHVLSLGGYYVKCAQMFCGMNLLPVAYEKEFSCLLDSVPAKHSFATIQSIIENELGGKLQDHFAEFDETPIAAASIGQVHCAKVRDKSSGDEVLKSVVVKVQYPEVEKYFKMDVLGMKNLCYLCTLCDIEIGIDQQSLDKIFNEFTSSFQEEFDYRLEAQNMKLIADNMEAVPEFANSVKVPHPFLDTTSRKVLTMEKIQGEPIKKRMNRILQEWAERSGKTMEELQQELQDKFQDPVELQKMMEQKPPSKAQLFLYRVMLWTWDLGANTGVWLENQLRSSTQQQKAYKWSTLPVDASRICRLLFQVHAHQLFINGAFNADPHAGNILICEDTNNTNNGAPILGLIDFGNVQRIPNQDRRKALAKFYLSMATDFSNDKSSWNDDEIARRFAAVGGESVHMDTAFLACNALTMYDMRFDAATLARLSLRH